MPPWVRVGPSSISTTLLPFTTPRASTAMELSVTYTAARGLMRAAASRIFSMEPSGAVLALLMTIASASLQAGRQGRQVGGQTV